MKIIAFVGMPASGKSEASMVARDFGINVINMGDVIREEVEKRGLEPTDKNVGQVANDLREREGMHAVAQRCVPKIKKVGSDIVVVDGVRGIAEVEYFKKEFGDDFKLISISAPPEFRFERIRMRGRSDDMSDFNDLIRRDTRELSWGMGQAMEDADVVVDNTSTLEEFKDNIERILR
ncbi:conserved hypothetical protein [Methanosalsum zhilinae DSM 4017]|uniref:UPF0200 protein Mzhil_2009 n=1 Tax=Methanosalsum zhilinae (strain DSM 4017 / NBRC 107636 / OCM 62 / WeN5) TaxID=679901 RepID=F7XL30_METZD|nr:dephospho-CoA kinase [Methanosalsum zhilinae]AEH61842.1 conserved hypothetical protein [Methanosalsum zhilinae DSM 4017]